MLISSSEIRNIIIRQSKRANAGHIGSALSIADIIVALFGHVLNVPDTSDPNRDRFLLSKGHAALALYAALYLKGFISKGNLNTYCSDGSILGVHPEHHLEGVDFSSGSLGHCLSMGTGAALAARLQKSERKVFVLLSDAECNEGSLWEAVMFASHHKLSNLVALIDLNGQQAIGYTEDVIRLTPMAERWRAFIWDVHEVDGHNVAEMVRIIKRLDTASGPPHVLVCRTVFGKGVSYMENKIKWHYWPMSDSEYEQAIKEIEDAQ